MVSIIITILIIFIVGSLFRFGMKRKKGEQGATENNTASFLKIFYSKEDALAQLLLLLGYGYLGISLFAINSSFSNLIDQIDVLLVIGIIGVLFGYYRRVFFVQFAGVIVTMSWALYKVTDIMNIEDVRTPAILGMCGLLSVILYLTMYYHSRAYRRFGLISGVLGAGLLTSGLLFLSSQSGIAIFADTGTDFWVSWPLSILLLVSMGVITGQLFRFITARKMSSYEIAMVIGCVVVALFCLFMPKLTPFFSSNTMYYGPKELTASGLGLALGFNVLVFLYLVGIVLVGYVRKSVALINIGGGLIFIVIIVKYFSWFWTLIDRSLFFIVAGVLLLGLGWLMERGRRKIVQEVKRVTS